MSIGLILERMLMMKLTHLHWLFATVNTLNKWDQNLENELIQRQLSSDSGIYLTLDVMILFISVGLTSQSLLCEGYVLWAM